METIYQGESSLDATNNSPHVNPINILFEKIGALLKTKKYKKAAKEIKSIEKDFSIRDQTYFLLFDIRMKCIFKQIKHKLARLSQTGIFFPMRAIMKRDVERLLNTTEEIFSQTTKSVKGIKLTEHSKELFIQNYIEALHLQAKYSMYDRDIPDCVSYLSIAHNVMTNYAHNARDPRTLSIYQNILLMLSNLLIQDSDYQTAIYYLRYCLKFCFQEIFIRLDIERGISIGNLPKKDRKNFDSIMTNVIICLFHIGICYENMALLLQAIEAYKQTRFFSDKFYMCYNPVFGDIIRQTEKRAFQYYDIHLALLLEKEIEKKKAETEAQLKRDLLIQNYTLSKVSSGVINDIDKYGQLAESISSFPFREAKTVSALQETNNETNRKNTSHSKKNSTIFLTSLRMYNDLLSSDYRPFVMQSNDLNFNYLKKRTKETLDQYNTNLKVRNNSASNVHSQARTMRESSNTQSQPRLIIFNNLYHNYNTITNSNNAPVLTAKTNDSFTSGKQTNLNSQTMANQLSEKRLTISGNQSKRTQSSSNAKRFKKENEYMPTIETIQIQMNKTRSAKRITRKHKLAYLDENILKYNKNNNYIFNKKYQKKKAFLDNMTNKETHFQRNVLKLMRSDSAMKYQKGISPYLKIDQINIEQDANLLFLRIKHKAKEKLIQEKAAFETESYRKREKATEKERRTKYQLEKKTIMGLDMKFCDQMKTYLKMQKLKMKKAYDSKNTDPEMFNQTLKIIAKNNNDILSSLSRDIDICDKKKTVYLSKR